MTAYSIRRIHRLRAGGLHTTFVLKWLAQIDSETYVHRNTLWCMIKVPSAFSVPTFRLQECRKKTKAVGGGMKRAQDRKKDLQ